MKLKFFCSTDDCDTEVEEGPCDGAYNIDELRKMPRFCFSCQRKFGQQRVELLKELQDALKRTSQDVDGLLNPVHHLDTIEEHQTTQIIRRTKEALDRAKREVEQFEATLPDKVSRG